MIAISILLKTCAAVTGILAVRDFCRCWDIKAVAFQASAVLFLCFGIWEMGQ